ncbi:hypothetical protein Pcinc_011921 [Petrolisthes cinctipes]|uniref:Uncharacterized protein n=1 Tax=Petrolisthes cinctipes TaxID=88211 RepID=A0AAE1G1T3_PETCI|nr:hypothetical protein Pcinc_011921 [Petrolisthes cinctipes]
MQSGLLGRVEDGGSGGAAGGTNTTTNNNNSSGIMNTTATSTTTTNTNTNKNNSISNSIGIPRTSRGHKRFRRNQASISLCDAHSVDIVYPNSAKGEKSGGVGSIHYRSGGLEGAGTSVGVGGGGGSNLVTASSSPSPTSSLPSAAEPPSHPVSLEVSIDQGTY